MESQESVEGEKLSKWNRNRLDTFNKFHTMRDDPSVRGFGFSHGNLICRSVKLSVIATFLFYALAIAATFAILGAIKKPRHRPDFTFLHFHLSQYVVEWMLLISGVTAIDLALLLLGLGGRLRAILLTSYGVLIVIVPMVLFHWSFLGN